MSRLFRAGLSAALVAFVIAFAPSTVLADANPNNHGHHYGQLKHRQPPPVPNPQPAPNPPPQSQSIVATTGGTSPAVHVAVNGAAGGQEATSKLPDVPVSLPVQHVQSGNISTGGSTSSGESWLLLLILPALVAVWQLVFARAALAAARRRRQPA